MRHRGCMLILSAFVLVGCKTVVTWEEGEMTAAGRVVAEHTELAEGKTKTYKIDTTQERWLKSIVAKWSNWLGRSLDTVQPRVGK